MYVKFKEYNSKMLEKIEEEEPLNKLNPEKLKNGFNILSV